MSGKDLARSTCIADLRELARRRLPRMVFDYIDGASDAEVTARENTACFDEVRLVPRMLRPVAERDQSVELFGTRLSMPVAITPTGFHGVMWPRGEAAVARAAASAGTLMVVSAAATMSLEEIAAASPGPKWFQLFIYRDRGVTQSFAERAKAAGYRALCLTVDVQAPAHRYRDLRNGFTVPPRFSASTALDLLSRPRWLMGMMRSPKIGFPNFEQASGSADLNTVSSFVNGLIDPTVDWKDFAWLRRIWDGPLVIKGIMHPEDAARAVEEGADAVLVSNHGGRQMDGEPSTIEMLPSIADRVAGRVPILLDSGIRRGTDVMKARALGATLCLIGRAGLYGLGAGGEAGVGRALELLRAEIDRGLAHGGWNGIGQLDRACVRFSSRWSGSAG